MKVWGVILSALVGTVLVAPAFARGVTPYLPLKLSPEIERDIERVLLLGGRPILKRPIAAATVLDALPEACSRDELLCTRVRAYLDAYMASFGVTHASVEAAAARDSTKVMANRRGMGAQDEWSGSVQGYWQVSDYALVQLGGFAYPGETLPVGSWVSLGFEYAQLDIGFREHWWSPMTDSGMLVSTQAEPMPSVTLSNYTPISRLGIQYELFAARMGYMDDIAFQGRTTAGHPRLAGAHISIEPAPGWSLSANRLLQFGGGERESSFGDFIDAFLQPTKFDNVSEDLTSDEQFGNQLAAIATRFVFPGRTPFAVYFEYAGEDGSRKEGWRLGNVSLSAGIDIPSLWDRFDLTYEVTDWQNSWYTNNVYPQGTSHNGRVIGHWGGDERVRLDGVGAQSHSLRLGWTSGFGGMFDLRYRTLENESYSAFDYQRQHELSLRYSRSWNDFVAGVELQAGEDVFGEDYSRIGGFLRFVPGQAAVDGWSRAVYTDQSRSRRKLVEIFVDAGLNASRLEFDPSDKGATPEYETSTTGVHAGVGARRTMSRKVDLGVRLELDQVDGASMISVRAIDYRYRVGEKLALTAFAGATRYNAATPAYGYFGGVGAQWRDIIDGFDLSLDLRGTDKIARDHLLPEDPQTVWGDMIYQIYSANLYLSYNFR